MALTYPATLERDDNGTWLVSFPDFPEAHTFGDTEGEALRRGADAMATVIDANLADHREIPQPSALVTPHRITVPADLAAKVAGDQEQRGRGNKR